MKTTIARVGDAIKPAWQPSKGNIQESDSKEPIFPILSSCTTFRTSTKKVIDSTAAQCVQEFWGGHLIKILPVVTVSWLR